MYLKHYPKMSSVASTIRGDEKDIAAFSQKELFLDKEHQEIRLIAATLPFGMTMLSRHLWHYLAQSDLQLLDINRHFSARQHLFSFLYFPKQGNPTQYVERKEGNKAGKFSFPIHCQLMVTDGWKAQVFFFPLFYLTVFVPSYFLLPQLLIRGK